MDRIERLKETGNTAGLIAVLRLADAPGELRARAADALGELLEIDTTESLVRAFLEDPTQEVKDAARQALVELHGDQLKLVLSSYRGADWPDDPWLVSAPQLNLEKDRIERLTETENPAGLIAVLRLADAPGELRARAAKALGELLEIYTTESLVRAYLEDPAQEVKDAALQALVELHGDQLKLVLSSYRGADWSDDPWLLSSDDDLTDLQEQAAGGLLTEVTAVSRDDLFSEVDFGGLISILRGDSPTDKRARAARLLQYSTDARAVEWLLVTALHDDEAPVRSAARETLEAMFPGHAGQMLQDYGEEVEEDEEDREQDEEEDDTISYHPAQADLTPSMMRESTGSPWVFIGLVIALAITAAILLLGR